MIPRMTPLAATFDCYGTLVDWEGGAASFLYQLALRSGDANPPAARTLRDQWERIQFDVISGPYRHYTDILAESLRSGASQTGYDIRPEDGAQFANAMRSWGPFPDTARPCSRLTTGASSW